MSTGEGISRIFSTTLAGDGFVLVGDAAGFLDPIYSPGMDWISFTSTSAAELISAQRRGDSVEEQIARHNGDFAKSYRLWFEAIYQDKYEYVGEFDLMSLALTSRPRLLLSWNCLAAVSERESGFARSTVLGSGLAALLLSHSQLTIAVLPRSRAAADVCKFWGRRIGCGVA